MPHVIIKHWPGKTDTQKEKLAEWILKGFENIFNNKTDSVSIAFEEVSSDDWKEKVYKPDIQEKWDTVVKKPGYTL